MGATLEPIANGAVAGWLVMGPRQESKRLLELLLDVALRPSFPATRMSMAIAMQREALESRDDGVIERAIAIALGQAAGLGRPLHMGPTAGTYERVTLAHTERHWRRIVQPDVGALVLMGSGEDTPLPDAITEGTWDVPALTQEPPAVVCEAQGRTAHLLVTPGSFGEHTIALWAAGAPGWSATDRRALDALTLHLDARQGGPIEGLVGASQARRASPDLVDLGHIAGEPVAAILIGTSGPPEKALADLRKVDSFLAGLGSAQALTEEDAARALRRLMGRRSASMHRPFRNAIARALDALSPPSATPITPDALSATAQMIFAPWRSSIVLVGSTDLREDIEREAPVALWPEDADEPAPASAVRCIAPGAKR